MNKRLNLIIPCYNPAQQNWAEVIVRSFQRIRQKLNNIDLGLVLVNDGSGTGVIDSDLALLRNEISDFTYISYLENRGKGYALRQGVAQSDAEYHVFTDVDFPYTEESVVRLIEELVKRNGIAAGLRNQDYYLKVPLARKVMSRMFRLFIRMVGIPVSDTQCGLKGFDNFGKALFLRTETDRYLFDFEFLILAAREKRVPIYSVPVQLKEGIVFSKMGWKVIRQEVGNLIRILC